MSNYGHYTQQYYGNKISFPKESFLIAGISKYQQNCKNITYNTILKMQFEPNNICDPSAICIINDNNIIGYVPNADADIKNLCKNNINESLKIINIDRINSNLGIRVIISSLYDESMVLFKKWNNYL